MPRASSDFPLPLPRLGVLYHSRSVEVLPLARASCHRWRTIWLIDHADGEDPGRATLLRRFGEVVDITGLSMAEVAQVLPEPLDGILATNDPDLVRAAELASQLQLPHFDAGAVTRLNDKYAQRQALRAAGLPTPNIVHLPAGISAEAAAEAAASLSYPAILKPAHGASSRATFAANSAAEVSTLLGLAGGPSEDFVAEERIPDGWNAAELPWADYVSVESLAVDDRITHFGITGRGRLAPGFRETASVMPPALPPAQWPELYALAEAAIRGLNLHSGVFHTEIKLSPDGPRILEVNGRLGGGSIVWLAERVTGYSLVAAAGLVNLRRQPPPVPATTNGVGFAIYLQPPYEAREVVEYTGDDALRALPEVEEVIVMRSCGDRIDPPREGSQGAVAIIRGLAADHDRVAELMALIESTLVFSYR
jgi:biotin carboxylase